jgi:ribonuclease-3
VYLDKGLSAAGAVARETLAVQLDEVRSRRRKLVPKQAFQELCQRRWGGTPRYVVLESRGEAHSRAFLVAAEVDDRRFPSAWGRTRKEAESWAAAEALLVLADEDGAPA